MHCVAGHARRRSCTRRSTPTPVDVIVDKGQDPRHRGLLAASRARAWTSCCASAGSTRSPSSGWRPTTASRTPRSTRCARASQVTRRHAAAVRGVDVAPGDSERALDELRDGGAAWRERRRRPPSGCSRSCARTSPTSACWRRCATVPRELLRAPRPLRDEAWDNVAAADRLRPDDLAAAGRRAHVRAARAARRRARARRRHRLGLPRRACSPGSSRHVWSVERHPALSRAGGGATSRRRASQNVTLVVGDGARGLPGARALRRDQRRGGGRARHPAGAGRSSSRPAGGSSRRSTTATSGSSRLRRTAGAELERPALERVRFVPLVSARTDRLSRGFGRYSRPTFAHGSPVDDHDVGREVVGAADQRRADAVGVDRHAARPRTRGCARR